MIVRCPFHVAKNRFSPRWSKFFEQAGKNWSSVYFLRDKTDLLLYNAVVELCDVRKDVEYMESSGAVKAGDFLCRGEYKR